MRPLRSPRPPYRRIPPTGVHFHLSYDGMVADEGVEPPPTGCKPGTLPLRQSAMLLLAPPRGFEPRLPVSETGVLSFGRWRYMPRPGIEPGPVVSHSTVQIHYTIAAWYPDQGSSLGLSGRNRVHYPLCYRGICGTSGRSRPHVKNFSRLFGCHFSGLATGEPAEKASDTSGRSRTCIGRVETGGPVR